MGTNRCKGGGEIRLVAATGTMQTDQTRWYLGFHSHRFDHNRRDRGRPSWFHDFRTGEETLFNTEEHRGEERPTIEILLLCFFEFALRRLLFLLT
jgi:hypothetical protein